MFHRAKNMVPIKPNKSKVGETKGKPRAKFDSPSVTAKDYVYSITKALLAFCL